MSYSQFPFFVWPSAFRGNSDFLKLAQDDVSVDDYIEVFFDRYDELYHLEGKKFFCQYSKTEKTVGGRSRFKSLDSFWYSSDMSKFDGYTQASGELFDEDLFAYWTQHHFASCELLKDPDSEDYPVVVYNTFNL